MPKSETDFSISTDAVGNPALMLAILSSAKVREKLAALEDFTSEVRAWHLAEINKKLDAMPRPNVLAQAAAISLSLMLGFGAGVLTNSKDWGWPVMVASWVQQHVPTQQPEHAMQYFERH